MPIFGAAVPQNAEDELSTLSTSDPRLYGAVDHGRLDMTTSELKSAAVGSWSSFVETQDSRGSWTAVLDRRSGLIEVAQGAGVPFVPGHGNNLKLSDLGGHLRGRSKVDLDTLESLARAFIPQLATLLGIEGRDLRLNVGSSGPYSDYFWIVEFDVHTRAGLKIEGSRVFFRINNGNLIQFGATHLPAPGTEAPAIQVDRDQALRAFENYLGGFDDARDWLYRRAELKLLPIPLGRPGEFAMGRGYDLLPVWEFLFHRDGIAAVWRVKVDAVTGKIVEFTDTNQYSQVTGGFWPVSWRVDGVTQAQTATGWPFTTVDPTGGTSNPTLFTTRCSSHI